MVQIILSHRQFVKEIMFSGAIYLHPVGAPEAPDCRVSQAPPGIRGARSPQADPYPLAGHFPPGTGAGCVLLLITNYNTKP